jgi:pyruvate dehydrogenase E1 component
VNRRGIFDRHKKNDVFRDAKLASAQRWGMSPEGSTSSSASPSRTCSCCSRRSGLSHSLYGARLLPIGTVYDPFVNRGLDALIYGLLPWMRASCWSARPRACPWRPRAASTRSSHAA